MVGEKTTRPSPGRAFWISECRRTTSEKRTRMCHEKCLKPHNMVYSTYWLWCMSGSGRGGYSPIQPRTTIPSHPHPRTQASMQPPMHQGTHPPTFPPSNDWSDSSGVFITPSANMTVTPVSFGGSSPRAAPAITLLELPIAAPLRIAVTGRPATGGTRTVGAPLSYSPVPGKVRPAVTEEQEQARLPRLLYDNHRRNRRGRMILAPLESRCR